MSHLLLLFACSTSAPPAPAVEAPRPSLVLITLDTTRADRLGAYGYDGARTPVLDDLAASGIRFDRAYATVPLTTPSHATILSGLYPTRHGVHTNGDAVLSGDVQTLAEVLQDEGYRTAASVSAFVTTRMWKLDQGFDSYFDDLGSDATAARSRWARERPAGATVDDAVAWLEQDRGPFFLWVHLFDAHDPYAPPAPFDEEFAEHPYDGEIAYMDSQLARLLAPVQQAAGDAGAAWVVVGDHGEAFGSIHGELTHGLFLYDETMRVPFILRPPQGLEQGLVGAGAVSTADLMPTALSLLGIEVPAGLDGQDLSAELSGGAPQRRPVYMESYTVQQRMGFHPELAMAHGDEKLMATPTPLLFDLAEDPDEVTNFIDQRPERAAELGSALEEVRARQAEGEAVAMSPELAAQLESLGYMTAAVPGDGTGDDAKDHLPTISALEDARRMMLRGAPAGEIEAVFRRVLVEQPELSEARMGLARSLSRQGRQAEALAAYDEAIARAPESVVCRVNRANLLASMGRHEEALAEMESVLVQVPGDDIARVAVLKMLWDLGRPDEALARGQEWLAQTPNDRGLQAHVGVLHAQDRDFEAAEPLLRASLEDGQRRPFVHRMLADVALGQDKPGVAMAELRREIDISPRLVEARVTLAGLHMKQRSWDEAAAEYGAVLGIEPAHPEALRGRAQAAFNTGDYELAALYLADARAALPDDAKVLLLHANILAKQGQDEEAALAFEEAKAARSKGP